MPSSSRGILVGTLIRRYLFVRSRNHLFLDKSLKIANGTVASKRGYYVCGLFTSSRRACEGNSFVLPVAVAQPANISSCFFFSSVVLILGVKSASQVTVRPSKRSFKHTPFLVSLDGDQQLFNSAPVLIDTLLPALIARSINKKLITTVQQVHSRITSAAQSKPSPT